VFQARKFLHTRGSEFSLDLLADFGELIFIKLLGGPSDDESLVVTFGGFRYHMEVHVEYVLVGNAPVVLEDIVILSSQGRCDPFGNRHGVGEVLVGELVHLFCVVCVDVSKMVKETDVKRDIWG